MIEVADPERALAVAYAPRHARAGLAALFALDERLGGIVSGTSEPMIGLMRLAWWREALMKLDGEAPPAEPLLQAAAADLLPWVTGHAVSDIEDGWAALLDGEPDGEAIARHGQARGAMLFGLATIILTRDHHGRDDPAITAAGAGWALADLGHRHSSAPVRAAAREQAAVLLAALPRRWPKPLRPLGALATLARVDAGQEARHQAAPARIARMLSLRATGF